MEIPRKYFMFSVKNDSDKGENEKRSLKEDEAS